MLEDGLGSRRPVGVASSKRQPCSPQLTISGRSYACPVDPAPTLPEGVEAALPVGGRLKNIEQRAECPRGQVAVSTSTGAHSPDSDVSKDEPAMGLAMAVQVRQMRNGRGREALRTPRPRRDPPARVRH
jgi:hypothetical protein